MCKQILVLVVGLILSSEACIATEGGQRIDGGNETKNVNIVQNQQNRNSENESAVGRLNQALERALWEIESKRLAIENERQRLEALIARVEKIDGRVKESEKGFSELIDQVSWGSEITTNILGIVLAVFGLLFALAGYGFYELYKGLRARLIQEHKRIILEHEKNLKKKTETAKYSIAGTIYWQLSTAFYSYYRLFLDHSDVGYQNTVKMALNFTEYALASYQLLPDDAPDKDVMLKRVEHAQFYHRASLRDESQAKAALDYALTTLPKIVEEFQRMNSIDWYYAQETRCWILIRYGDAAQKDQAIKDVRDMLANSNIPVDFRDEVKHNYERVNIILA